MANFLTIQDYKAVCDPPALALIDQNDGDNLARAEGYAIEEVSGYLRSRYDAQAAFALQGEARNPQLVMVAVDITLYHLVSWLPQRMGYEIREIRYNAAIAWLRDVQAGKTSPDLPTITPCQFVLGA